MSHVRKQIRDELITRLTGLSTTGSNVNEDPFEVINPDNLPCLCIYTGAGEIDEEQGKVAGIQERSVDLIVECCAQTDSGISATLETILSEVETAVFTDRTLGGLCFAFDQVGEGQPEYTTAGEKPAGVLPITFRATYMTNEGAPEVAL